MIFLRVRVGLCQCGFSREISLHQAPQALFLTFSSGPCQIVQGHFPMISTEQVAAWLTEFLNPR